MRRLNILWGGLGVARHGIVMLILPASKHAEIWRVIAKLTVLIVLVRETSCLAPASLSRAVQTGEAHILLRRKS